MSNEYYKRYLPHIQPKGSCFFVTFRLFGSLPLSIISILKEKYKQKLEALKHEKDEQVRNVLIFNLRSRFFKEFDKALDQAINGPHFLSEDKIRDIVANQIKKFDGEFYNLIAYSIMSNHVHILIDTSIQLEKICDAELSENYVQLDKILKRIKGATAVYCNRALSRSGKFWARESYDMYIRNEKMLQNVISYILENPIKAELVEKWEDYPGNYLR